MGMLDALRARVLAKTAWLLLLVLALGSYMFGLERILVPRLRAAANMQKALAEKEAAMEQKAGSRSRYRRWQEEEQHAELAL
jgi:hypothetical protein